jgi:hypothetical protein
VSSTSGSCSQPSGGLVGADAHLAVRAVPDRDAVAPPAGGRCTSRACRRPSRTSAVPGSSGESRCRRYGLRHPRPWPAIRP